MYKVGICSEIMEIRIHSKKCEVTKIRCTPYQKLLVVSDEEHRTTDYSNADVEWIPANKLKPGMQLVANDNIIFINKIETIKEKCVIFNNLINEEQNFTLESGCIVHC